MPASRHQDHTALPSAFSTIRQRRQLRPSHPVPNARDDRETPLLAGTGWRELVEMICPTSQAKMPATHWHDGQISRCAEKAVKPHRHSGARVKPASPERRPPAVMPALVAGIHVFPSVRGDKDVDGRDKPGHDDFNLRASTGASPLRRHQRLHDFRKRRQCLAARGVGFQ
jgi:hypothetical protein